MVKEAYDVLRKEFPLLPDFAKLDHEFEVSTLESDAFLLRNVKRKMGERLEPVLEFLERAINPDPSNFTDLHECRCFTGGEKQQIIDIFRILMQQYRLLLETDLLVDDSADVEAIKKFFDVWVRERKQIVPFVKKIRGCWEGRVEPKEILEYLG